MLNAVIRFALQQRLLVIALALVMMAWGVWLGLQALVYPERADETNVIDIIDIIHQALQDYQAFESFPYDVINQSIVKFEGRPKRP